MIVKGRLPNPSLKQTTFAASSGGPPLKISPTFISRQKELKVFELMWFEEVLSTFKTHGFKVEYTNTKLVATRLVDITTIFTITINSLEGKDIIEVKIPFSGNLEYKTTFTDFYKATEYILYHLKEFINNQRR